jgi:hypothetical protein
MMDVALTILAVIAGGVTLEVFVMRAPVGYQDEHGFHLGTKMPVGMEDQIGNPS